MKAEAKKFLPKTCWEIAGRKELVISNKFAEYLTLRCGICGLKTITVKNDPNRIAELEPYCTRCLDNPPNECDEYLKGIDEEEIAERLVNKRKRLEKEYLRCGGYIEVRNGAQKYTLEPFEYGRGRLQ